MIVGVDDVEGPPVPIPNTVVKLNSAENTWAAAPREDRSTPTLFLKISFPFLYSFLHFSTFCFFFSVLFSFFLLFFTAAFSSLRALIAQSVEHAAVNRGVAGSSPA